MTPKELIMLQKAKEAAMTESYAGGPLSGNVSMKELRAAGFPNRWLVEGKGSSQPGTQFNNALKSGPNERFAGMTNAQVNDYVNNVRANNPGFGNNPNPTIGKYTPAALEARGLGHLTAQEAYLMETGGHKPGSEFNRMNNVDTKNFKKGPTVPYTHSGDAKALQNSLAGIRAGMNNTGNPNFDPYQGVARADLDAVNKAKQVEMAKSYGSGSKIMEDGKMSKIKQLLGYGKTFMKSPIGRAAGYGLTGLSGIGTGLMLADELDFNNPGNYFMPQYKYNEQTGEVEKVQTIYDVQE